MQENEEIQVNGKVDLGTRRLIISHVENATTFYAYLEPQKDFTEEMKVECKELCEGLQRLSEKPGLEEMVGVFSSFDKCWYRGKVEQLDQGKGKDLIRVRMIDIGWNSLYRHEDLCKLPDKLREQKVLCEKYKMADLKPKGRADGYTAEDRQRGAEWLKRTINDRVVISSCHKQVNYAGGIMADCMVGDINLNKAALKQGHAILIPPLIGKFPPKKNSANQGNMHFRQAQFTNQFQNQMPLGNGSGTGSLDLDYTNYNGNSSFKANGKGKSGAMILARSLTSQMNGKTPEVKKLERKINEDKKTISELRKTTNLDVGIKDLSKLLDKVNQARGNDPDKEAKGNFILAALAGVSEVIEESCYVAESFLMGIKAVECAARRVSEEEKLAVQDPQALKSVQSKSDLHRCINAYLEMYNDQTVEDELSRVNSQLTTMNPNIPPGGKTLPVKAEDITRENLLDVAEKVKTWIEDSVTREAALTANSKKEVESLCRSLDMLSKGLLEKQEGNVKAEVPKSLDAQLGSARKALQAELTGRTGGKLVSAQKGKGKAASNDMLVLKSAWKALTALKNQFELARKKSVEYESMLTTLEPLMS